MRGLFCNYCKSLMPPGSEKCRVCGRKIDDDSESNQMCFGDNVTFKEKKVEAPKELHDNKDAPYFPYIPRPNQMDIVSSMRDALDSSKHIVVESGTGTGKTIVSLAAALEHAKKRGKRVIYLTRTISQSDQVMKELRSISELRPVTGIAITGRGKSCPLLRTLDDYENIPPQVLSSLCEERKKKSMQGVAGGCRFFDRLKVELPDIVNYAQSNLPSSEVLDNYCEKSNVCPYEAKKALMKDADVVVVPYVHILSEDIRSNLLSNMGVGEEEDYEKSIVLIVDEAHNIIDAARETESFTIPMKLIEAALDETTTLRDPDVYEDVKLRDFIAYLRMTLRSFANEYLTLKVHEYKLKDDILETRLMERFKITRSNLETAIDRIIDLGEARSDLMMDKGENRISDIYNLGINLKLWICSPRGGFIRSIKAGPEGEFFSAACIDPNNITSFMRSLNGAIHMSGTLQPLDQYVRVMGLPKDTVMQIHPSPFPKENRSVVYMNNVTTSYKEMNQDPSIFSRMEKNIAKMCNAVDKNTLVFFPSYAMMAKMKPFLERDVNQTMYWEEARQQKRTMALLDRFRKGSSGVFFTVMGGSIAEGIDFPGDELCFAIIVGIPYPPPSLESNAMSDLFDARYGNWMGWKYTFEVPAIRKMQQAIGRLIRTETDRGMAVIMDSRMSKYTSKFDAVLTTDPVGDVVRFFEQK